MATKKKILRRNKKTRRKQNKIRFIKKNNIKLKIKNLGKTKRRNKKIQYGCSVKNMKGGDATLNPFTEVRNNLEYSFESLGGTLHGENTNNLFTNYNNYP